MRTKSIATLALLFVMSFSVVHEFAFAYFDDGHCSPAEYISEIEAPTDHGDICDTHYEYHTAYVLPQVYAEFNPVQIRYNQISQSDSYLFKTYSKIIKPPIA